MTRYFLATFLSCACFFFLTGCPATMPPTTTSGTGGHGHDHAEVGPHKGHLIELGGGEFHAELTHTEADHDVTIYLLDEKVEKPVTTTTDVKLNVIVDGTPQQFTLLADPGEMAAAGKASKFSVKDEKLCDLMHGDLKGQINVTINDKQYTGELAHEQHGDHGHGHEHK